ncbi:hypothetical protein [Fulvivirga sedimenti]|uniref:Lipocalin-like domain-containing protein n=1 Tax=Fulvivirga sedimenti TaxID=2879465 RepID=A0A9X1HV30_9BACT|nr:hypothetical protein [Fulvivirga sedimenti]MCA6075032.1 hypothetical protein [Fulvivirga sedimenti]MCA6076209.1 hypothetical protein [Fulvivirga sedimenti]MCA6077337.1 hypothetical protein [Fulvivirga sedimenti]
MKRFEIIVLVFIVLFGFNCSSDDSEPTPQVTIEDFEGSWIASSAIFTNKSNSSEVVNFIAAGGEIRYTMLPGGEGRTRTWIEFQNNPVDEWDAIISLGPNKTYISTPAEAGRPVVTGTYEMGNNTITLTNSNDSFDFANSGNEEPATSVIVFVPNN